MTDYPFDLGPWSRTITTNSAEAQKWFDRGLNWVYGYNHEEAVRCFHRALAADPGCAMAWWGVAYAAGPFYNRAWSKYTPREIELELPVCHQAAQSALALAKGATAAEQALIHAIVKRYVTPDESDLQILDRWHWEFTDAMAAAHHAFPDDLDIAALFAEAAVTCTVRMLWNMQTGQMCPNSRTAEAMAALEQAFAVSARTGVTHPGVLHMHIHAMEMSHDPESALLSADGLRGLAPDAGHLEHMPAHIYVICGDYEQAVAQSVLAVAADDKYLAHTGGGEFYTTAICHDLHLYMYSAMLLGRKHTAFHAVDRVLALANDDLIAASAPYMASLLDTYGAMSVHVRVRFGLWDELTRYDWRPDPAVRPIGAAMALYGAGVAHSALGQIAEAEAAQAAFRKAVAALPEDMILLSNTAQTVLMVGDAMLDGELKYRKGDYDAAFDALRLAVVRDDALNYTEPWAWMHPPRHALGALLAEQGRLDEAEQVFRIDMGLAPGLARCCHHPDNVWALKGLLLCVEQRDPHGRETADLRRRLSIAESRADVAIRAACCCAAD